MATFTPKQQLENMATELQLTKDLLASAQTSKQWEGREYRRKLDLAYAEIRKLNAARSAPRVDASLDMGTLAREYHAANPGQGTADSAVIRAWHAAR